MMKFDYKTADITCKSFGALSDETPAHIWYLANRKGLRAEILDFGGIVNRVVAVGGDLKKHNVVLGARDLASYEQGDFLSAALRTSDPLTPPVMHAAQEDRHLAMKHVFDEGPYAGIAATLRFALTERNEFILGASFSLSADAPDAALIPPVAPLYFNLAGQVPGNALDHAIAVDADRYIDLAHNEGVESFPLHVENEADFHDVEGTPADYREGKTLMEDILTPECLGGAVAGFDYCFSSGNGDGISTAKEGADALRHRATVYCGRSRLYMDVEADTPMMRLTTFQPFGGIPVEGKGTSPNGNHSAIALCPMPYTHPFLQPGESVSSVVSYRFTPDYPEEYRPDSGCLDRII